MQNQSGSLWHRIRKGKWTPLVLIFVDAAVFFCVGIWVASLLDQHRNKALEQLPPGGLVFTRLLPETRRLSAVASEVRFGVELESRAAQPLYWKVTKVVVSLNGNAAAAIALPEADAQGQVQPHQKLSFHLPWSAADNLPNSAVFGQLQYVVEYGLEKGGPARVTGKTVSFNQITRALDGGPSGNTETVIKVSDEIER